MSRAVAPPSSVDLDRILAVLGPTASVSYAPPNIYPMSAPRFTADSRVDRPHPQGLDLGLYVMTVDAMPLTPSGKVDRRALPAPGQTRPRMGVDSVAPRGPLELVVAAIWADVLGLDEVGVHDAFLDLGGNSLLAMRVVARVLEQCQVPLSPRALFDAPTVARMAEAILVAGLQDAGAGAMNQALDGPEDLSEERRGGRTPAANAPASGS